MSISIDLGKRPNYPITITKILRPVGSKVDKQEPVLQYSFKHTHIVGSHLDGNTWPETKTIFADWESPVEGELKRWYVEEGQVITRDQRCFEVEEACIHPVQVGGLCGVCGKDVTSTSWESTARDTDRATIKMVHDNTGLTVSKREAERVESKEQRRLLSQRKLILVVDLDQTIIQACCDPTVEEWQNDETSPNYEAVKDVRKFALNDPPRSNSMPVWYYIKLRPGLEEFLDHVKDKFELHIYTMGTRAYAVNIAKLIDPEKKLFGNRIISRDENEDVTSKSLQRLFPTNTNMVAIIDDRADVWSKNRRNLIKVTPFDFFKMKGGGDINASFLPERQDQLDVPNGNGTVSKEAKADENASTLEPNTSSGSEDAAVKEHEKTLERQINDRPLQHLQEQLDKEEESAEKEANGDDGPAAETHHNHPLLVDDDHELKYLEQHLLRLHEAYFEQYDDMQGDSGKSTKSNGDINLATVPDVGNVLDSLKSRVLSGVKLVLSGIFPMGVDIETSEVGLQLKSFGAQIRERVTRDITHLVVSLERPRTQKVQQAAKHSHIKIVNPGWIAESLTQWTKVDETPYLLDIHPSDRANGASPAAGSTEDEMLDDEDPEDDSFRPRKIIRGEGLKVKIVNDPDEGQPILDGDVAGTPVTDLKDLDWGNLAHDIFGDDEDDDDEEDNDDEDEDNPDGDYPFGDPEEQDGQEDDDQEEDMQDTSEQLPTPSRKRKHDDDDVDASESEATNGIPKKRLIRSRCVSSLRDQFKADDEKSDTDPNDGDEEDGGDFTIDEDDLEAELEAELEAMSDHES